MHYINPNNLETLKATHFDFVKCIIRKRVGSNIKCSSTCSVCNGSYKKRVGVDDTLKKLLENENTLEKLILSKPEDLLAENNSLFTRIFGSTSLEDIRKTQKKISLYEKDQKVKGEIDFKDLKDATSTEKKKVKIFNLLPKLVDYNEWFNKMDANAEYGPYKLTSELDIRACTYCNRQYTLTVHSATNDSSKLTRPQLDHWISKDDYPLLGLSFYNLIPSCPTCNSSVKGNIKFNTKDYIHPYLDDLNDFIRFDFKYWSSIDKYKIKINSEHPIKKINKKIANTLKTFKIEEVYNGHLAELNDLIQISKAYSPQYIEILKKTFKDANLTNEQIYRYAFSTELNSKDFHKRPLSKFKHDILKELGVI